MSHISVLFTTDVVIGYEETLRSVSEAAGTAELCVRLMMPPSLDQVSDLQVFLSAATSDGTASMLKTTPFSHHFFFHGPGHS